MIQICAKLLLVKYQQPVGRHLEQAAERGGCDGATAALLMKWSWEGGTKSWERCWRFCHRDNTCALPHHSSYLVFTLAAELKMFFYTGMANRIT